MALFGVVEILLAIILFTAIHYWKLNRNTPITKWPVVGMLPGLFYNTSNIHDYLNSKLKQCGGTFTFEGPWLANMNIVFTCDPMNVQHITSTKFENYGKGNDFREIFEVLGDGIFRSDSDIWKYNRTLLHSIFRQESFQKWLRVGEEKTFIENQKIVDEMLYSEIKSKRDIKNQNQQKPDLLSTLMNEVRDGENRIDDKFLRDTAINLLAAGRDTISSSLTWFFWLVATHPFVEAKILEEIKEKLASKEDNKKDLGVEGLSKLVYLHGALLEALRLYPPVPFEHKSPLEHDVLPSGHKVKENTMIVYSLYSVGRVEEIWGEDCLEFKPERWISKRGGTIHVPSYKFIAFNAGPRSCLGKDISFIQLKMVAVAMLLNYHVHVVEDHPIIPSVSVVLYVKDGLKVNIKKRSI
ncbi:unnamed protein product [Lathyrus oleraceus]|uniref:Cytochrome P450 n=1 Tax=Pisum sativum TaxID=3888 RepID=A0A9D4ZZ50_PEA|nr:hypothetical protein KIW84_076214 [Pisum sativum]